MADSTPDIWTIGHSTRSFEDFLALLRAPQIQVIADVRRFPASRRHMQFGQAQLMTALGQNAIRYEHFGDLGGRRVAVRDSPNASWRNAAFRGYADYMETDEFKQGMERLLRLSLNKRICIMCAEAVWWRCHRGLISDWLKSKAHRVFHIIGPGRITEHPYTSAARIVDGKLSYRAPTVLTDRAKA